ncbi:hypothetical protein Tdes44962_MAKER09858 [Teratosphaeria destructans]|uniref:Uncharacterized protein n=1 Tax=Teratosphaeria destructans TaxID=418781 RepID=A0A9W7SR24_9PEZI|nr:hypothetical protein Tdes44962_MAKER09858 [Teratosphaeria destructans]
MAGSTSTSTTTQSARRTYSAEELRRLRNATSQPKLREAIEEHDGEDAELVKEHVLRGSKSFAARSWRSRQSTQSLRVPSDKENRSANVSEATDRPLVSRPVVKLPGVLGEIAPNNQAIRGGPWRQRLSPTPSLRKKKIESLVKAHGSPQHVRVTAGGRIVPSEQSPLCHPRYGYSAVQINGGLVKFAPNHPVGKAQWSQATQNGFVAQDVHGRLCQIVNGTVLPLTEVDGALQLYMPAPNLNITQRGPSTAPTNAAGPPHADSQPRKPSSVIAPDPPHAAQISALELEYSKLDAELKDLNKTEVLHGRTMGRAAREALVSKRRELVVGMDNVRKALKSLRDQAAPPDIPTATQHGGLRRSMSPTKSRLPGFLQQRQDMPHLPVQQVPPAMLGPFFGAMQPPPYQAPWGIQPVPSPESAYGQPWAMPPAAMFAQPPPFDGSVSAVGLPSQSPPLSSTLNQEQPVQPSAPVQQQAATTDLPQNDGSCSVADLEKISPSRQSHAVLIKAPESKGLKSSLNPMSPVYKPGQSVSPQSSNEPRPVMKPVEGRAPTPMAPFHQLNPSLGGPLRVVNHTDEPASPPQRALVQSSSIASFETVDFFPRNTREYSTRRHEYPDPSNTVAGNKENVDLQRHDSKLNPPMSTPEKLKTINQNHEGASPHTTAPAAPPGTPVNADAVLSRTQLPSHIDERTWERQDHGDKVDTLPDRGKHNLSPKIKRRDFLFVEERPEQLAVQPSPSPDKYGHLQDELCVQSSPDSHDDFLKKPRDFVEGYQAGLKRQAPAVDRSGDWIDGYCAGLKKATSASSSATNVSGVTGHSDGSPTKPNSRRPSPVGIVQRSDGRRNALMPIEAQQSMDTLKQAILAPQNENAVLTPAADGPHITEAPLNLGAWARQHGSGPLLDMPAEVPAGSFNGFHFPPRTSSMVQRQPGVSDELVGPRNETLSAPGLEDGQGPAVPLLQKIRSGNEPNPLSRAVSVNKSIASSTDPTAVGARVSNMTSIDSNLYRHWPGPRVFSPHLDYKSISSVAQQAGFASGFFAQVPGQFDGTHDDLDPVPPAAPKLTHAHPATGPAFTQRPYGGVMGDGTVAASRPYNSHFKESSLDGMSNAPASPLISPKGSPNKASPTKGSPARTKFEHIAGKVGIKVPVNGKEASATPGEPVSPKGKGLWHKAWGLGRKDGNSGEGAGSGVPAAAAK